MTRPVAQSIFRTAVTTILSACLWFNPGTASSADTLSTAQYLMRHGDYAACLALINDSNESWNRDLQLLRIRALMITGPYEEAATEALQLTRRYFRGIEALMLAHDAAAQIGRDDVTKALLERIQEISVQVPVDSWTTADRVALGRAALLIGSEPKFVLDQFFNRAVKQDPQYLPAYFAAGELALSKNDYALAAQHFSAAAKQDEKNPDVHFGLARCEKSGDRIKMMQHLTAALETNPKHIGCLLLKAEHEIDLEQYEQAGETLQQVEAVNAALPELWCFRSVLAHLAGDEKTQAEHRAKALVPWPSNPLVDHLIGTKLSDKYRFKEGAEHQRRALAFAPTKIPATIQLAQDLLRLGQEKEGWALAEHVANTDGYQVVAHNLAELRRHLGEFETIENDQFIVRMDRREAAVYGSDVMDLLAESRRVLCGKYGLQLDEKITVEIFANQQDFAIRTFGVPGGAGYLGVCFGKVITLNSPAGLTGGSASWRSVLWHEFCHTVTLHMSKNKMPRWLSEGISVHEELQRDPSWGQRMTPTYRRMIINGELSPISKMSGAFLHPPSGLHLMFAYYQSALAVEFMATRYGQDHVRAILTDLGNGLAINAAIEKNTAPMAEVETQFKAFVHARVLNGIKSEAVLAIPGAIVIGNAEAATAWAKEHVDSYWSQLYLGGQKTKVGDWAGARHHFEIAVALDPGFVGEGNAYDQLAQACGALNDHAAQQAVWTKLAELSPTAMTAFEGLMKIAESKKDWAEVSRLAERLLSVNPMLESPRRTQARAAEATQRTTDAIAAYNKLLALGPTDAADVHFSLGRLLAPTNPVLAKRHVLEALADAPRFRAAHALLLQLTSENPKP
jgi:tetratricopeptide (TPR) repeat protein